MKLKLQSSTSTAFNLILHFYRHSHLSTDWSTLPEWPMSWQGRLLQRRVQLSRWKLQWQERHMSLVFRVMFNEVHKMFRAWVYYLIATYRFIIELADVKLLNLNLFSTSSIIMAYTKSPRNNIVCAVQTSNKFPQQTACRSAQYGIITIIFIFISQK